jgi:hypothetical protein
MFLLGLLGLLQMTILPGWLWLRAARIRTRNPCEEGVYCFAASLILNSPVIYFLTAVGQNNQRAWLLIIAAEATLLTLLHQPWKGMRFLLVTSTGVPGEAPSFRSIGLAALAVVTMLAFVLILIDNWGTVFISHDDVASWDRWAQDWFLNRFPVGTDLYPQLVPANWSITYALMRTADVKMFAKAMMPFFAVATLLLFVSLAWNLKDRVYLAGCTIAGFLFLQYLGRDFLMTGYVDVALAFFCFLAFYVLYQEDTGPPSEARFLSIFFAAGAALTKQGGLLVLAAVALYLITKRTQGREPGTPPALRWTTGLAVAFVILWYVPKFYGAAHGQSNLRMIFHDIHGGRNYAERLWYGCRILMGAGGRPGAFLFAIAAALMLCAFWFTKTRGLTLGIVLPAFLFWGFFFSYEVRTGALIFPFAALVLCLTLQCIGNRAWLPELPAYWTTAILLLGLGVLLYFSGDAVPRIRVSYTWPLILVGACVALAPIVQFSRRLRVEISVPAFAAGIALLFGFAAWPHYADAKLLSQQLIAQRQMGNPAVNARLYRLHDAGQLAAPILSNYWYLSSLPELKSLNRNLNCLDCSLPNILEIIAQHRDTDFLLLQDTLPPPSASAAFAHCPGIDTIFVEGTVRLFRLDRSKLHEACSVEPETVQPIIVKLYPSETLQGKPFNLQPDGAAALAVGCRNASMSSVLIWAGTQLPSAYDGTAMMSAEVPALLYAKPGHYPIEILDKDTGLRSPTVYFDVK